MAPTLFASLPRVTRCGRAALALALLLCLPGSGAQAQQAGPAVQQGPWDDSRVAPVIIDGRRLFLLRGITSRPARARAANVRSRIIAAARDPGIAAADITLQDEAEHVGIYAGDKLLVFLFDADAEIEDLDRNILAIAYRDVIINAIESYRTDRTASVLLRRAGYGALLSVVMGLALLLALRLFKSLERWVNERVRQKLAALDESTHQLLHAGQVRLPIEGLLRLLRIALLVSLGYFYLDTLLGLFPWTRSAAVALVGLILFPVQRMGQGLLEAIPDLVFLAVLYVVMRYLLKVTKAIFDGIAGGRIRLEGFDPDWSMPTYRIVRMLFIICALVIAYPYIPGSDSLAFKGISVFVGVLFSLGSSSFIANIIAGLMMTYRGAFKVGDRVRIGDSVGSVEEIRLMITRLRTSKNEVVVIPNSNILNADVVNYSVYARQQGLIVHTTVGIGYDTPWRQVEAMLRLAAARTEGLKREPPPFVLQQSLGDYAVNYEINAYCDHVTHLHELYSRLHANIQDVFNEYGVQIMSPIYVADPAAPKVVPPADWYAVPAAQPAPAGAGGVQS